MQISRFINRFDDCKNICSLNIWVRWQHSCSNAVPIMIDNLLHTSPKNGHMSQKWSYKISCFTIYVSLDANMLQMLKKLLLSNQNNDNLDKIKNCIAFVIGNVFK